ncbi:MAG: OmpA family protein [Gammaproteobacteria bacterium]
MMIGLVKNSIVLMALLMLLVACATNLQVNNIEPTLLKGKPDTEIVKSLGHSFDHIRTFTVVPTSVFSGKQAHINNPADENHLLFMLRNMLEGRGYQFVAPTESADLIATIDGFSEYQASLVRQKIKIMPLWEPGEVYSLYGGVSALDELPALSDQVHLWGNYYVGSPASVNAASLSSAPQGLLGGFYYPQLAITLFDSKTKQTVWNGIAAGASSNSNLRVSSQLIMRDLIKQIPLSKFRFDVFPRSTGRIGVGFAIASIDGNNYYPLLTGISENSPAAQAGIRTADFLIAINGADTLNKSTGEVAERLVGQACTILKLKLWRMGEYLDLAIKREPRRISGQHAASTQNKAAEQGRYVLHPKFNNLALLSESAQQELDAFVDTFRGDRITRLMVVAYTDSSPIRASSRRLYSDNYVLSQARAENVAGYLKQAFKLSHGQVSMQGRGSDEPIADNATVAGRAKNRRVEITVTRSVHVELSDACRQ